MPDQNQHSGLMVSERKGVFVKGKPYPPKAKEPIVPKGIRVHTERKSIESQVSKVDWQYEKLTPEQWRFLNHLFAQFAELLAPQLTPVLGVRATMELEEIVQQTFKEFLGQFPNLTIATVFAVDEKSKGLFMVDASLAFSFLDYLMAGKGEGIEDLREFTELEQVLFKNHILSKFFLAYSESWKVLGTINPQVEDLEFSPNRLVVFPYGEFVLATRFSFRAGNVNGGYIHLVLPLKNVRSMLPRNPEQLITGISRQGQADRSQDAQAQISPLVGKKIETTALPVSVELGKAEVFFQDLLHLEVGDTLRLETTRGQPLRIKVANKTKFLGKPGSSDKKMAIRITEILPEGDESLDD